MRAGGEEKIENWELRGKFMIGKKIQLSQYNINCVVCSNLLSSRDRYINAYSLIEDRIFSFLREMNLQDDFANFSIEIMQFLFRNVVQMVVEEFKVKYFAGFLRKNSFSIER